MSLPKPVEDAVKNGLELEAHGGKLKYRGPKPLVFEVLPFLKAHKPEIMDYLHQNDTHSGAEDAWEAADRVAEYCQAFYNHIFGPGKVNNCCYAPANRYCKEGRRLKDRYYQAVKQRGRD